MDSSAVDNDDDDDDEFEDAVDDEACADGDASHCWAARRWARVCANHAII